MIVTRRITMSKWSNDYINRIEAELRRKIMNPQDTRIKWNIIGNLDEINMKVLAFLQIRLTGFAYLPDTTMWDDVAHWSAECPFSKGVERYSQGHLEKGGD